MPYVKTEGKIYKVNWNWIADRVTPARLAVIRSCLNGSDKGQWTVYQTQTPEGFIEISKGRKVLEKP